MHAAPQLTVEIHDVASATFAETRRIEQALRQIGVTRPTLLVVPAYQTADGEDSDLRDDPALVDWLQNKQRAGAEIVQHGLTHRAPSLPPAGLRNHVMHHYFSRGCAEFAHLSAKEAERRLDVGRTILSDCGLRARGFIAPAWQQSPAAIEVLRRRGYRFTAFFNHVLFFGRSVLALKSPALTFAAANPVIDRVKRVVMRAVEAKSAERSLLRVALHPEDAQTQGLLEHIVARLARLLQSRRQTSYAAFSPASCGGRR